MGLNAYIYRNPALDSALNSPLRDHWRVCVVNVDGPFDPTDEYPPVMLVELFGYPVIAPAVKHQDRWVPRTGGAGGAYVETSDGRFASAVERISGSRFYGAVPLHDRFEQGWVA